MFNHERFVRGTDIQAIFAQLDVTEPTHAFYLGKELARASLAVTLGKTYRQEGALPWGYLTPPDDARAEHVGLTQRRRASDAGPPSRGVADVTPPAARRELTPPPDPVTCVERLAGLSHRVFLDSAAIGPRLGRYSFVTADPVMVIRTRSTGRAPQTDGPRSAGDGHGARRGT